MGKWEIPDEKQRKIAERIGLDPEGIVVKNLGQNRIVFLHLKSRAEYSVSGNSVLVTDCQGHVIR